MDRELDFFFLQCQKIRDRETRPILMQKIAECKNKSSTVMAILRNAVELNKMNNEMIAQLNHCGFDAIKKQGAQKKLDERAIKNEKIFLENDAKVKYLSRKLNSDKLLV